MDPRTSLSEFKSFAHEVLTGTGSSQPLTASVYAPSALGLTARLAVISVDTANIRYWTDGGDPTATDGIQVVAGTSISLVGMADIKGFRFIAVSGSPKVQIQYKY